jgi:uncharacterized membrane protein
MSEHAQQGDHGDALGFERLVFFSDAVLAIAITLMALEIRIPELELQPDTATEQINVALRALTPHVLVYILSFLVVGSYWLLHHRLFRLIQRYDVRLTWLNLIFLMFVALLPASTNALGNYPDIPVITALYAISVALVGLSEWVVWWYASMKRYVRPMNAARMRLYIHLRILVPPLTFLFSLCLLPLGTLTTQLSWAATIPVFILLRIFFPREHAERRAFEMGES